jgi:TRAP-type C4-dicarboxylate transport system permease small subunit
MKEFTHKVLSAVAPVFGVSISIAILQAAQLPFPPQLSLQALPQWAVFAAVVYTSTAFCMFITARIFRTAQGNSLGQSQPAA